MLTVEPFVYSNFNVGKETATDISVDCPFCQERYGKEDTKQKLQISIVKETCHCWRCEYSASWVQLVQDVLGCSYIQAMATLYVVPKPDLESVKESLADTPSEAPYSRSAEFVLPPSYIPLNPFKLNDSAELRIIKKYLRQRGFGVKHWAEYQLGWVAGTWRVYIPIEGEFWQARAVLPHIQPKYMSPINPSADVIFNYKALTMYDELVVTEGAFSAMAVGLNAVALVGKNPTLQKVQRLRNSRVRHFIIAMESRAWSMLKLADELSSYGNSVELWEYENDTDPADYVEPQKSAYDFRKKVELQFARK